MEFLDGLPKPNGATDYNDSSHLAGILWMIDHPQKPDMTKYIVNGKYVRHPSEAKYDLSRDQFILLSYGLWKQGRADLIDLNMVDGKDIMPPSVKGMIRIMKGKKAWPWQRFFFLREFDVMCTIQRLEEPFQLMAMAEVYGLLNEWKNKNKLWKWAIRRYFSHLDGAWRNEPELAEQIITKMEGV